MLAGGRVAVRTWSATTARACSIVAGAPSRPRPSVRKSWRAITLLLNLLMSLTTSASGGEVQVTQGTASMGQGASRTWPRSRPPASFQAALKALALCSPSKAWGQRKGQAFSPQAVG